MFEELINNKYIIPILFLIFLAILWFFKDKIILNKKKVVINEDKNKILEFDKNNSTNFIKSDMFNGFKHDYVFKTDNLGTGYYLDN